MFNRLDLYLLRNSLWLFAGFLALAIMLLLTERLVRLTEALSGAENVAFNTIRLLISLSPHYFELALPGALLLSTILAITRMSRSNEITTILASGVSLYRVARPFFLLGVVLGIISIITSGYLQPATRYYFRSVMFELRQDNVLNAFSEFEFVQFKNRTVWTESFDREAMTLGETFIYEHNEGGAPRLITGKTGQLENPPEGGWTISLQDAMIGSLPKTLGDGRANSASTGKLEWHFPFDEEMFRSRGLDERELTLNELFNRSEEDAEYEIAPSVIKADAHDRLVRASLLPVLAIIGTFLGLNLGRNPRTGGLVTGIVLLLALQKLLEFGLLKAQQGLIPAWAGAWPVFALFAGVTFLFFARANGAHFRQPSIAVPDPDATKGGA